MEENVSTELKITQKKSMFWKKLDSKQKSSLITLLIVMVSIPLALLLSNRETRIGSDASDSNYLHENNTILFSSSPYVAGNPIKTSLSINTKDEAIDGVQFMAYLNYSEAGMIDIQSDFYINTIEYSRPMNAVTNSIIHEPLNKRYKLSFSSITSNPTQPYSSNNPVEFGSFNIIPTTEFDQASSLSIEFDNSKTKMISHTTGENLAVNQAPYYFDLYNPPTSTPVTPIPSSTPTPTSTPQPTTPPTLTRILGAFEFEGYSPNISTRIPQAEFTLYNANTLEKAQLYDERYVYNNDGNKFTLQAQVEINLTEPTKYILVINGERHHQAVTSLIASPYAGVIANFSIEQPILAGDITDDFVIDIEDYHQLAIQFDPVSIQVSASADLNFDQRVDIDDYNFLSKNFNPEYSSAYYPGPQILEVPVQ